MSYEAESKNPDDMTPTEREAWLRDRGVIIETPNDRREVESILSSTTDEGPPPLSISHQVHNLSLSSDDDNGEAGVKFVYIPQDTTRPISTLTLPKRLAKALGPAGDVIPTYVKSFFADGKSIDDSLFKEQAAKQNLLGGANINEFAAAAAAKKKGNSSGGDSTNPNFTSSALTNATADGSVETFPLVRPSSTNHNQGVYIYLDEVGLLKHLPNNQRASTLSLQCGYNPAPNFYGDVFVGRVSSANSLHNIDIVKEDIIDTQREWLVRAPQENISWQQAMNGITGRKGESQPSHAGTEGKAVQVESSEGDGGCSYSWLQNDEEVEITVSLSTKVVEKKLDKSLIKVVFHSHKITVKYGGESILVVKLYSRLDVDGSTWTLDKDNLVVTCEKASEGEIWPRLELST